MGGKKEAKTFMGVAVELLEEVAKYLLKALIEKTKTVNKGKRAVVRARTRNRMSRLASKFKKAKSSDEIQFNNVANREELAWRLGVEIKPVMTVRAFKRQIRNLSLRRLLFAEKKLPGGLLYLFGQKVVESGEKTSFRPMEYGKPLKKGDKFRLMLSWNRNAFYKVGLKTLFKDQPDVHEVKIQQLGSRGQNGIARRFADGNFYYLKANGTKGRYANVYDSLIEVHSLKTSKKQKQPSRAPIAKVPRKKTTARARTASYMPRPRYAPGSLNARRISHPKYSPDEGVKPLAYNSYFATIAEQKRFDSIIESIQEIKDQAKLLYLAKQIRANASDREPIVKYMGKYARYGTMLVFALFKRDLELIGEKTNNDFTITITSALRRLEQQGKIRARNEAPIRKKLTEAYRKKLKKQYPELTVDQIDKKLKESSIQAKIEKEVSAIVSKIAAKKTASSHLSGSAVDMRIKLDGVSLLSHYFRRDLAKGQTIYAYKRAWIYYNLVEDGGDAMTKYEAQLRARYKAKYPNESATKIERRVSSKIKRDKYYYDKIRLYRKKNRYGQWKKPHWDMMVARRKVYKLTNIRKYYPTEGGELTSELWHKYVGKTVYKKPELARRVRPGTSVRVAARKPDSSVKNVLAKQRKVKGYSVISGKNEQSPEQLLGQAKQHSFIIPNSIPGSQYMFASMLMPKRKMKGKTKMVVYFSGSGAYDNIVAHYRKTRGKELPPPSVLNAAGREDFVSKKKKILAWLTDRWDAGENIGFVLVSHMRPYNMAKVGGKMDYSGERAALWYNAFKRQSSANRVFNMIREQYVQKSGSTLSKDIHLIGHSRGGKSLRHLQLLKHKGLMDYNFSYAYSDSTYSAWPVPLSEIKKGAPLYISFWKDYKTAAMAKDVIKKLGLKGEKVGDEIIYTSSRWPNVVVVASKTHHSWHPQRYISRGWAHIQKTMDKNYKYRAATRRSIIRKQAPVIPISHNPVPVDQRQVTGYSMILGKKDHVPKYIRRRRERMYKEIAEHKGDLDITWFEKKEVNGGRPVYITKLGPNNGQFVPGLKTVALVYKHGHGDPRVKMRNLVRDKWQREKGLEGTRGIASRGNVNVVIILAQGNSNTSSWPELQSAKNFKNFVDTSLSVASVPSNKVVKRGLVGHSGASYFMIHPLRNLPVGYLNFLGLADTGYGEGVGYAYYKALEKILIKHRMSVFARYRYNTPKIGKDGKKIYKYPWHNNEALRKRLERAIAKGKFPYTDPEKDIHFHYTKRQGHTQILATTIRDAVRLAVLGEKAGEEGEILKPDRFAENDFDAERAKRISRGEENVAQYETKLDTETMKCPFSGKRIYITKIGPNNGKFNKTGEVKMILNFNGHGNQAVKWRNLTTGARRKQFISGLQKRAVERGENFVLISFEGESNQPDYRHLWDANWPKKKTNPVYDAGRFLSIMQTIEGKDGIKGRKIKRVMLGHSGAYRVMEGLGHALDPGYLYARGDLDTKYGKKRHKRAEITHAQLDKHNKMKYYSLYTYTADRNDPYYNDQRLRAMLNKDNLGRTAKDVSFNLTKEGHTPIKSLGAMGAVNFFFG